MATNPPPLPTNKTGEIGIEIPLALILFFVPYGADQMNIHSFWIGAISCNVTPSSGAYFLDFPKWVPNRTRLEKTLVSGIFLAIVCGLLYKTVQQAYEKNYPQPIEAKAKINSPSADTPKVTEPTMTPDVKNPAKSKRTHSRIGQQKMVLATSTAPEMRHTGRRQPDKSPAAVSIGELDLKEAQRMTEEYILLHPGEKFTKNDLNIFFKEQYKQGRTKEMLSWGPKPKRRPDLDPPFDGWNPTYIPPPCHATTTISGITFTHAFIPIYDSSGCLHLEDVCMDNVFIGIVNASNGADLVPIIDAASKAMKENGGRSLVPQGGQSCVPQSSQPSPHPNP